MHVSLRAAGAALLAVVLAAGPALAETGPDVSRYQHPGGSSIDWQRVADSGQSFAFIKATEGTTVTNAWFPDDRHDARAAGLYVGAYHFARPSTESGSAAAQARAFASLIGDQSVPGTLPPVLDLENAGGLSRAQLVAWTRSFLTTLQSITGRTPIVYTYPSFWQTSMGGTSEFAGYPLWIAHYTRAAAPTHTGWQDWAFWQYSDRSTVSGVRGDVDMNRFRGTSAELAALALAPPPTSSEREMSGVSPGALAVPSDSTPGRYTPVAPSRVLDTRTGTGAAAGQVQGDVDLVLPDSVPADSAGVVLSVSAVSPRGNGWVRAASPSASAAPTALNYSRSSATGLVVSRTDASRRVRLSVGGAATYLTADLVGYYDTRAGEGGGWVPAAPTRILDSRGGLGTTRGAKAGDVVVTLPPAIPAGARAAVLNVSVVDAQHDTFVQVGTAARATVLNVAGHRSRTGLVFAAPSPDRTVTLSVRGGPAQLVVDLLGHYDASGTSGSRYVGTAPARVVDTRSGLGGSRGGRQVTVTLPDSVPAGGTAVLDVSAVDPTGDGFLRVSPAGEQATTTALNHSRGESQTGLVMTRTDASRRVTLTVTGATADLVVDLVGHTVSQP